MKDPTIRFFYSYLDMMLFGSRREAPESIFISNLQILLSGRREKIDGAPVEKVKLNILL